MCYSKAKVAIAAIFSFCLRRLSVLFSVEGGTLIFNADHKKKIMDPECPVLSIEGNALFSGYIF